MTKEEKELKRIEHKKRTWKSKFIREHEIWYEIVVGVNSRNPKERDYWCRVMDLYHKKYSRDKK